MKLNKKLKSKINSIKQRNIAFRKSRKEKIKLFKNCGNTNVIYNGKVCFIKITSYDEYLSQANKYKIIPLNIVKARFQKKNYLYLLVNNIEVISYGWLFFDDIFWIAEIDLFIKRINSDSAGILYDFYTDPTYRGHGYYANLLNYIEYDNTNYNNLIIYAKDSNLPSIKGINKAGFKYVCDLKFDKYLEFKTLEEFELNVIGHHYSLWGIVCKKYQ